MLGADPTKIYRPNKQIEATIDAKAPDWLRLRREFDIKGFVSENFNNPVGTDKIKKIDQTGYLAELNKRAQERANLHTATRIAQEKPQGDMSRAQYLDSLDEKEREFVSKLPNYQVSLWAEAQRGIQSLGEFTPAASIGAIAASSNYTADEKAQKIAEYAQNPVSAKVGDAFGVFSPLGIPAKMVQATYTPDYTLKDAFFGQKNNASLAEEMIMDPLNLAGVGMIGGVTKMMRGARGVNMATDAASGAGRAANAFPPPNISRPDVVDDFFSGLEMTDSYMDNIMAIENRMAQVASNDAERARIRVALPGHPKTEEFYDRDYRFQVSDSQRDVDRLLFNVDGDKQFFYQDPLNLQQHELTEIASDANRIVNTMTPANRPGVVASLNENFPRIGAEAQNQRNQIFVSRNRELLSEITDPNITPVLSRYYAESFFRNLEDPTIGRDEKASFLRNISSDEINRSDFNFRQNLERVELEILTPIDEVKMAFADEDHFSSFQQYSEMIRDHQDIPSLMPEIEGMLKDPDLPDIALERLIREIRNTPVLYERIASSEVFDRFVVAMDELGINNRPISGGGSSPFINFPLTITSDFTGQSPQAPNVITNRAPEPKNKSGLTMEESINMYGTMPEVLNKMSAKEYFNTYTTPKGEILPFMDFQDIINNKILDEDKIVDTSRDEYVNRFNNNIDDLNEFIIEENKTGKYSDHVDYFATGLERDGILRFDGPTGRSKYGLGITEGLFFDDIKNVGSPSYIRSVPGLKTTSTTNSVFGDGIPRRGSGSYRAINRFLKKHDMGRVKDGDSGKSSYSKPLWENSIKKDEAYGFVVNRNDFRGVFKSIAPYTLPLGAGALQYKKEEK